MDVASVLFVDELSLDVASDLPVSVFIDLLKPRTGQVFVEQSRSRQGSSCDVSMCLDYTGKRVGICLRLLMQCFKGTCAIEVWVNVRFPGCFGFKETAYVLIGLFLICFDG